MPRRISAAAPQSPSVTATFTMPPAAPAENAPPDESKPDFREYIFSLTPEQWKNHVIYLTRELPKTSINGLGGYLTKLQQPFDFEDIKQAYGGYEFSYFLKEGNDICKKCRNASGRFKVEAPPRFDTTREIPGTAPAVPTNGHNGDGNAALLKILEEQIRAMREQIASLSTQGSSPGQDRVIEMMADGAKATVDMIKTQLPQAKSSTSEMREMITTLKDLGIIGGGAAQQKTLVEQIIELVQTPVIGPQILALFAPKNPLDEFVKLKGFKELLDSLGGGGGGDGKGDWKTALVDKGVPALQDLVGAMAENRKVAIDAAREQRLRAEANERASANVREINAQRNAASVAPHAANAPQPAAPPAQAPAGANGFRVVPMAGDAAQPGVAQGAISPATPATAANADEYLKGVKIRFVELLAEGQEVDFIVDFLDGAVPEFVKQIHSFSSAQVTNFFRGDPILANVVAQPGWPAWLEAAKEYLAEDEEEPVPAGATKPN